MNSSSVSDVLNVLFSYGGWALGLVLSLLEIREARSNSSKSDLLLEELRKLKAQNVLLQLKFDNPGFDASKYKELELKIMDIADTESPR